MASGLAALLRGPTGYVDIGKSRFNLNRSPMYENIEWLNSGELGPLLQDYIGHRRYVDYKHRKNGRDVLFPDHRPTPGVLMFSEDEVARAAALMGNKHAVMVEPHVKGTFSGENKRWPWINWQAVVEELKKQKKRVVQISAPGTQTLKGVDYRISESDVRVALACLAWADPLITTDGLLHHAAAALGIKTVVIWGSRTDPLILGYDNHVNLSSGPPYCGMRTECEHCKRAMWDIRPEGVLEAADCVRKP